MFMVARRCRSEMLGSDGSLRADGVDLVMGGIQCLVWRVILW